MQPVKAKKHLGQHFLTDENTAKKIVDTIEEVIDLPLLEIGPGTGVLTKYLIGRTGFLAIEIDPESVTYLQEHFPEHKKKFIRGDFLSMNVQDLFAGKFAIIGNFPYNISSQIMFRVIELRNQVDVVVGMFQKEVAQRIAEKPGTKAYGILSVLLQAWYDIEYLFTVNENVFSPPPRVKSAVIRLKRNTAKELGCDERSFFNVVKTSFNQRRKMLRNSLKGLVKNESLFTEPVFTKRPEQLSVQDFVMLTNMIHEAGSGS